MSGNFLATRIWPPPCLVGNPVVERPFWHSEFPVAFLVTDHVVTSNHPKCHSHPARTILFRRAPASPTLRDALRGAKSSRYRALQNIPVAKIGMGLPEQNGTGDFLHNYSLYVRGIPNIDPKRLRKLGIQKHWEPGPPIPGVPGPPHPWWSRPPEFLTQSGPRAPITTASDV